MLFHIVALLQPPPFLNFSHDSPAAGSVGLVPFSLKLASKLAQEPVPNISGVLGGLGSLHQPHVIGQ